MIESKATDILLKEFENLRNDELPINMELYKQYLAGLKKHVENEYSIMDDTAKNQLDVILKMHKVDIKDEWVRLLLSWPEESDELEEIAFQDKLNLLCFKADIISSILKNSKTLKIG